MVLAMPGWANVLQNRSIAVPAFLPIAGGVWGFVGVDVAFFILRRVAVNGKQDRKIGFWT